MQRIYLDYAATTPVDPRVLGAMQPYFSEQFGNPGSLHSFGQEGIAAVDHAREVVAHSIDANFREIIFTGSASEANNLALRGVVRAYHRITNQERINESKNQFVHSKQIRYSLISRSFMLTPFRRSSSSSAMSKNLALI